MEKLGIDLKLILVQIVNFGLLLFILKKVLYKPVLESIKKRREELEANEKEKGVIEKAKLELVLKEKEEILKNAKREAEAGKRKIIDKANRESKEILQGTRRQIERDQKKDNL